MKHYIFLCLLTVGLTSVMAQPDSVKVGIFVTNLYDFNLADGSFTTEFWTWSLANQVTEDYETSQEVSKSKKTSFSNVYIEEKAGKQWMQKKCTSVILQDWDVRKFPFDKQVLRINLEDAAKDASELVYIGDVANSKLSNTISLDEWDVDSHKLSTNLVRYNTTYGDPALSGESVYPSVALDVYMHRTHSWVTFIKLVTGVLVAFLISVLVFFIKPPETETRIGLAVGGLFAAVGNKYIVESVVPTTTQTTMIDYIHILTFAEILFIIIMIIVIGNRYYREDELRARSLETFSFWFSLLSFIGCFTFVLFNR